MGEVSRENHSENIESFETKKTKYFSDFALSLKTHFKTLKEGGISGKEAKMEGWRNISEHCIVEAVIADVIAEELDLDKDKLKISALVHDWYKRKEVEGAKKDGVKGFEDADKEDKRRLLEMGYSEEIINISHSVGHTSLEKMLDPNVTIEEQVMHYIDDITNGTDISLLDERVDKLEENPKYHDLNESGREIFNGKTYFEVQREVGKSIEEKIARVMGIDTPELLPQIIKEKINKKIEDYK